MPGQSFTPPQPLLHGAVPRGAPCSRTVFTLIGLGFVVLLSLVLYVFGWGRQQLMVQGPTMTLAWVPSVQAAPAASGLRQLVHGRTLSWCCSRNVVGALTGAPAGAWFHGRRRSWCLADGQTDAQTGTLALETTPAAQEAIRNLMAKHDPILLYVSRLLKPDIASDAGALYAWCRRLDELVDNPALQDDKNSTRARLDEWKKRLNQLWAGSPRDEMDAALLVTLRRHPSLGLQPFVDMLEGMRSDAVDARRILTSNELDKYAYQVAGTVGLMLLPLLGVGEQDMAQRREPAIALGQAIQLINILRDARPDAALNRIYLPQDEMQELGIHETEVIACKCTPAYKSLVMRTAARAEAFLLKAEMGGRDLPGAGPLFVSIIVELYRDYLTELARRGYDNLSVGGERVSISTPRKVLATLRALVKLLQPPA